MGPSRLWVIVPAAGRGTRFSDRFPKQFSRLHGQTVAQHSLARLLRVPSIERLIVPCDPEDPGWRDVDACSEDRVELIKGGKDRTDSVLNGLKSLSLVANEQDWILVHDIVRPCVTIECIMKLIDCVRDHPVGGILTSSIVDTVKLVGSDGIIIRTINRDSMRLAQTPQIFRFGELHRALKSASESSFSPSDEASALEWFGRPVLFADGRHDNIKITHPEDLAVAGAILSSQEGLECA